MDKIVQLSRYQPSFFSSPERTKSIKKLFQFFDLDLKNKDVFKNTHLINIYDVSLHGVNLSECELRNRIDSPLI